MPGAVTSLVPYKATDVTSLNGTQYKATIDANGAILANPAGSFYVYPNSPAAMNVLVDGAFNYFKVGTGPISNEAGTPITVATPAPGSGTVVYTIYWDLVADTAGAVVTAINGAAIMPEHAYQMPLAFVSVLSTTTSITASAIQDLRGLHFANSNLSKNLGTVASSQTVNCSGARVVSVQLAIATAIAITLTLTNLQNGVPVYIRFDNLQATAENFKIAASTPSGVAYNVVGKNTSNIALVFQTTGMTASGSNNFFINGSSNAFSLNLCIL